MNGLYINFTADLPDGSEEHHRLPARYEVCDQCHGTGSHVNPAVDGNGITADEMAELGDEFFEDYMGGVYDVPCSECKGERVVLVVEEDDCDPVVLKLYYDDLREEAEYRQMVEEERRAGC